MFIGVLCMNYENAFLENVAFISISSLRTNTFKFLIKKVHLHLCVCQTL